MAVKIVDQSEDHLIVNSIEILNDTVNAELTTEIQVVSGSTAVLKINMDEVKQILSDMANDGKITPVEKVELQKQWDRINLNHSIILSDSNKYSLIRTVQYFTYADAYPTLADYLNPILAASDTTTDIDDLVYKSKFDAYFTAYNALAALVYDAAVLNNTDLLKSLEPFILLTEKNKQEIYQTTGGITILSETVYNNDITAKALIELNTGNIEDLDTGLVALQSSITLKAEIQDVNGEPVNNAVIKLSATAVTGEDVTSKIVLQADQIILGQINGSDSPLGGVLVIDDVNDVVTINGTLKAVEGTFANLERKAKISDSNSFSSYSSFLTYVKSLVGHSKVFEDFAGYTHYIPNLEGTIDIQASGDTRHTGKILDVHLQENPSETYSVLYIHYIDSSGVVGFFSETSSATYNIFDIDITHYRPFSKLKGVVAGDSLGALDDRIESVVVNEIDADRLKNADVEGCVVEKTTRQERYYVSFNSGSDLITKLNNYIPNNSGNIAANGWITIGGSTYDVHSIFKNSSTSFTIYRTSGNNTVTTSTICNGVLFTGGKV